MTQRTSLIVGIATLTGLAVLAVAGLCLCGLRTELAIYATVAAIIALLFTAAGLMLAWRHRHGLLAGFANAVAVVAILLPYWACSWLARNVPVACGWIYGTAIPAAHGWLVAKVLPVAGVALLAVGTWLAVVAGWLWDGIRTVSREGRDTPAALGKLYRHTRKVAVQVATTTAAVCVAVAGLVVSFGRYCLAG